MPLYFVVLSTKNLPNAKSSESVKMLALIFHLKLVPTLHLIGSKVSSEKNFSFNRKRATTRREYVSMHPAELTALLLEDNQVKNPAIESIIHLIISENLLIVIKEQQIHHSVIPSQN